MFSWESGWKKPDPLCDPERMRLCGLLSPSGRPAHGRCGLPWSVPEDLEKAGQVLESKGFKKFGELHIHHIAYIRENLEVEMHFAVGGIPSSAPGERVRNAFADILEQSKEIQLEGGRVRVPSDFHHGLSLLLHTNQHLQGDGIGLRHLCDWAVFAGKFSDREFRGTV